MAEYKADLRWEEGQRLTDRTITSDAAVALAAFRELLGRPLAGKPVAARLVVDGRSLYFSNFAKDVGSGRIHPDAPLSTSASRAEADELARWLPKSAARQGQPTGDVAGRAAAAPSAAASPTIEAAARELAVKASGALAYVPPGAQYDELHQAIERVIAILKPGK